MQQWAALIDLAIGRHCLDCGRVGQVWCDRCLHRVLDVHPRLTPGGQSVVAAARYAGSVPTAIVAHKEQGHLALAAPLGRLLVAAMVVPPEGVGRSAPVLVPVPSTRAASRTRGQDHARRLARAVGALTALPVEPALRWSRQVHDQAALSARSRSENVRHAMSASPPPRVGARAWLVDDVMTTGATLDEGVRALETAGWPVAGVSVVATVDARSALARRDGLR
ncbi:MAG: ComF family protein [Actinomycetia bacterium]|nr:ComF family protein [Actinomycetes bacterium]